MFGCDSAAAARASRSKRVRSAVGASILTATRRSSSSSSASQTELIAPRPRGSISRYLPAIISSGHLGGIIVINGERASRDRRCAGARARTRAHAAGRGCADRPRGGTRPRSGRPGSWSTCRRSTARRWTAMPCVPPTRPAPTPSSVSPPRGSPGWRSLGPGEAIGDLDRRGRARRAPTPSCRSSTPRGDGRRSSTSNRVRTCARAAAT